MADGAGSIPAGSSEDAPSENCENTCLRAEDSPSSPYVVTSPAAKQTRSDSLSPSHQKIEKDLLETEEEKPVETDEDKLEESDEEKLEESGEDKLEESGEDKLEESGEEKLEESGEEKLKTTAEEDLTKAETESFENTEVKNLENREVEKLENTEVEKLDNTEVERPEIIEAENLENTGVENLTELENPVHTDVENLENAEKLDNTEKDKIENTEVEKPENSEVEKIENSTVEDLINPEVEKVEDTQVEEHINTEQENLESSRVEKPSECCLEEVTNLEENVDKNVVEAGETNDQLSEVRGSLSSQVDDIATNEASKSDSSLVDDRDESSVEVIKSPSRCTFPQNEEESKREECAVDVTKTKLLPSGKPPQMLRRILYTGYKKKETSSKVLKPERRIITRGNPFTPSWKKESKLIKVIDDPCRNVVDLSPDSSFQDCTHYLGLQPSINFRCNHCGMSGFESIQLLNLHQGECRKVLGHSTSTNIKITRKVYLCSACGTYYESWHLFYHMRKVHDKFMCLYCLGMFTYSEKLCEHLTTKHQVNFINFPDIESFKKCNLSSYLFLCLECDNVMSDTENFRHTCTPQKSAAKIATKQQVQNVSAPCIVVGPSPKKNQDSNNTAKNNLTEDAFVSDPSNFCHVDMMSPKKDIPATPAKVEPPTPPSPPTPPPPPPPPTPPPAREKEPTKISTALSEFPKIDLQPPKIRDVSDRTSEKMLDLDSPFKSGDESKSKSDGLKQESRNENKNSVKVKLVKRKRVSTGRQSKRPKLDPEKQKSALEKLTETIDAVAKNYRIEPSPPTAPPPVTDNTEDMAKSDNPPVSNYDPPLVESNFREDEKRGDSFLKQVNETSREEIATNGVIEKPPIWKSIRDKNSAKFKLNTDLESDEESDDSNKLSMVIDETPAHSDNDSRATKLSTKGVVNTSDDSNQGRETPFDNTAPLPEEQAVFKPKQDEIALAGEDVPAMALTLDDKVQNVKVQLILKECVRTSCMSCNYCRRAIKIAVNGKYLALHLLSEHRYTPTKNDSPEDVINKLKSSLDELSTIYFNTESYDSSDTSIHVPYDKDSTFDCFQCSFVTNSHKDLHIHKRKSHTKSLLLCIMCKINFYSYSELLCHLCPGHYNPDYQFNNIDMNFRCCFCKLDTIPSAFRLMVHLRKCHHTCDICLEVCSDQQKLSTHMWKHKLNHLCYRCGIAYASKLDITKHLFWKHGTESVLCKKCLQKKWPHVYHFCIPPTSFLCEECNSSFSKAVALKVHKRIHAGDFSYQCTQCDKKFVSKKLLQKHEDQHNNPVDTKEQDEKGKEEIIDVTGESTGNTDGVGVGEPPVEGNEAQKGSDKENETSKHHKKHKKDKKAKQVIDVYDLPPLNLSSDSDSSDDESTKNTANELEKDVKDSDDKVNEITDNSKENDETAHSNDIALQDSNNLIDSASIDPNIPASSDNPETKDTEKSILGVEMENSNDETTDSTGTKSFGSSEQSKAPDSQAVENTSIWENFYKTNSNNKNLPYPLCAMKSEDAYKIIMGDHDYCLQLKTSDPVIKEDILQSNLECDKVDTISSILKPDPNETTASDSSPTKKKQKSPKKKSGNNSSSSSDSSSDSDSSSCSCGENCSCSSSSSDSSSTSSSDSDSSASENGNKQRAEKRKKKKEKKSKSKPVTNIDQNGENKTIVESVVPAVPEEPAVRESDLDTEESSTDEEFYDRQPQKLSNQLLAEKRNQLMLLASVAPVHGEGLGHELTKSSTLNEAFSDLSGTAPSTPDHSQQPPNKKVNKNRRKKSFMMKSRKRVNKNYTVNNVSQPSDAVHKSPKPYVLKLKEHKRPEKPFGAHTPPSFIRTTLSSETNSGGGSESESVRASKRKRIPNKFYGYSSGEEEERLQQHKWRKPEVATPPPPPPPPVVTAPKFVHSTPQTPRIQLSVPKQVIRKNHSEPTKVRHYLSGNDSTDSSSDNDKRFVQQPPPQPPPPIPQPLPSPPATKQDKNLYCYCRCPYDEVSEMIACDDENCKIEWFHFECVGISVPPKGQWFCPQCSKKRGILP